MIKIPPPTDKTPPKPTLTIKATPDSVAYKGSATISWQAQNITSLLVNGTKPPKINFGFITVSNLARDSLFKFSATGINGKTITDEVLVKVGPKPLPTRTDTLYSRPWQLSTESRYFFDGKWFYTNWSEDRLADKYFFYPTGKIEVFDQTGKLFSNGMWSWVGQDSIKNGGTVCKYELTDTTFVKIDRGGTLITAYWRK